jgi:molecular chaperone DnaK (HSP70)
VVELVLRSLVGQSGLAGDAMVDEAVVGAPVDFGLSAQDALRRAVQQADLYVSRLVLEPVAAAAHYGLLGGGRHHVVVCDLGATRLEVSALAISDAKVRIVHASCRELVSAAGADAIALAASAVREAETAARGGADRHDPA